MTRKPHMNFTEKFLKVGIFIVDHVLQVPLQSPDFNGSMAPQCCKIKQTKKMFEKLLPVGSISLCHHWSLCLPGVGCRSLTHPLGVLFVIVKNASKILLLLSSTLLSKNIRCVFLPLFKNQSHALQTKLLLDFGCFSLDY